MPVAPSGTALQAFPVHVTASDALVRPNRRQFDSQGSRTQRRTACPHCHCELQRGCVSAVLLHRQRVEPLRRRHGRLARDDPIHRVENQARRQRLPQSVGDCTVTAGRTSSPSRAGRQPGRQRRRQRVRQRCGATCASPKLGRDTPPTPNANRNTARSPSESTTVSVYQVDASVTVGVPATIRAAG